MLTNRAQKHQASQETRENGSNGRVLELYDDSRIPDGFEIRFTPTTTTTSLVNPAGGLATTRANQRPVRRFDASMNQLRPQQRDRRAPTTQPQLDTVHGGFSTVLGLPLPPQLRQSHKGDPTTRLRLDTVHSGFSRFGLPLPPPARLHPAGANVVETPALAARPHPPQPARKNSLLILVLGAVGFTCILLQPTPTPDLSPLPTPPAPVSATPVYPPPPPPSQTAALVISPGPDLSPLPTPPPAPVSATPVYPPPPPPQTAALLVISPGPDLSPLPTPPPAPVSATPVYPPLPPPPPKPTAVVTVLLPDPSPLPPPPLPPVAAFVFLPPPSLKPATVVTALLRDASPLPPPQPAQVPAIVYLPPPKAAAVVTALLRDASPLPPPPPEPVPTLVYLPPPKGAAVVTALLRDVSPLPPPPPAPVPAIIYLPPPPPPKAALVVSAIHPDPSPLPPLPPAPVLIIVYPPPPPPWVGSFCYGLCVGVSAIVAAVLLVAIVSEIVAAVLLGALVAAVLFASRKPKRAEMEARDEAIHRYGEVSEGIAHGNTATAAPMIVFKPDQHPKLAPGELRKFHHEQASLELDLSLQRRNAIVQGNEAGFCLPLEVPADSLMVTGSAVASAPESLVSIEAPAVVAATGTEAVRPPVLSESPMHTAETMDPDSESSPSNLVSIASTEPDEVLFASRKRKRAEMEDGGESVHRYGEFSEGIAHGNTGTAAPMIVFKPDQHPKWAPGEREVETAIGPDVADSDEEYEDKDDENEDDEERDEVDAERQPYACTVVLTPTSVSFSSSSGGLLSTADGNLFGTPDHAQALAPGLGDQHQPVEGVDKPAPLCEECDAKEFFPTSAASPSPSVTEVTASDDPHDEECDAEEFFPTSAASPSPSVNVVTASDGLDHLHDQDDFSIGGTIDHPFLFRRESEQRSSAAGQSMAMEISEPEAVATGSYVTWMYHTPEGRQPTQEAQHDHGLPLPRDERQPIQEAHQPEAQLDYNLPAPRAEPTYRDFVVRVGKNTPLLPKEFHGCNRKSASELAKKVVDKWWQRYSNSDTNGRKLICLTVIGELKRQDQFFFTPADGSIGGDCEWKQVSAEDAVPHVARWLSNKNIQHEQNEEKAKEAKRRETKRQKARTKAPRRGRGIP
jgi:hypothetical protein